MPVRAQWSWSSRYDPAHHRMALTHTTFSSPGATYDEISNSAGMHESSLYPTYTPFTHTQKADATPLNDSHSRRPSCIMASLTANRRR